MAITYNFVTVMIEDDYAQGAKVTLVVDGKGEIIGLTSTVVQCRVEIQQ